ncbi:hypothetical protein CDAR_428221 [Caerostris darwini]|uniref:Snake toxin/toxin-like domain-containing protein n=1 Tax=Caerostris darwini TaxID=1538125 RepID=A0AAV4WHU8_9ARAC|nr:hypothetical protein CDAR_428221 [Caerostris darwini]
MIPSFTSLHILIAFTFCQKLVASHLTRPPHNLSCYHCSTLNNGDSCRYLQLNDTGVQKSCKPNQIFCSVILFRYAADSTDYLFWSVERRCEETCQEGCNTVGERVKLFLCRSCCNGYLCNFGSAGLKALPDDNYMILFTGMALYRFLNFLTKSVKLGF